MCSPPQRQWKRLSPPHSQPHLEEKHPPALAQLMSPQQTTSLRLALSGSLTMRLQILVECGSSIPKIWSALIIDMNVHAACLAILWIRRTRMASVSQTVHAWLEVAALLNCAPSRLARVIALTTLTTRVHISAHRRLAAAALTARRSEVQHTIFSQHCAEFVLHDKDVLLDRKSVV